MTDPSVPPASASSSAPPAQQKPSHDEGGIKETIEAILVAFILAFVFRGFVVEAFVIPTGSMAPTLLGAHMRFICDDCGYQFDTNFDAGGSGDDVAIPRVAGPNKVTEVICPNCGYHLPKAEPGDPAYNPLVRYGDRILVLKYLYLMQEPHRWDVVVFKSPDGRERYDYTQNYIKRLVGRPGESVMILDGDVYVGEKDASADEMRIQTKPREVQDALWRIVHDSDYQPRGMPRTGAAPYVEPWTPRSGQTGWNVGISTDGVKAAARVFTFDNASGAAEIFFNDAANIRSLRRTSAFNDWLTYDTEAKPSPIPPDGWSYVTDAKIQFFYDRQAGDGELRVALSKRNQNFVAIIGPDSARLMTGDVSSNDLRELIPLTPIGNRGGPRRIELQNVDYRVSLLIDGQEIFATTPAQYRPNLSELLQADLEKAIMPPQVRIIAANQRCAISHMSIWRDVYYLSRGGQIHSGTSRNIVRLNGEEYFVLGDNSQISGDGRYWSERTVLPYEDLDVDAGKVPGRFMLGKAFFVYWPAGYTPFESQSIPAIAPNFGDMRMID